MFSFKKPAFRLPIFKVAPESTMTALDKYIKATKPELVYFLQGFWGDQMQAITYKELREAALAGYEKEIEQWQQDYAAWQVDPVTATCADGTTVTLTGKIRSGSWQPGEEYSFQLEEPVTSLVFPIWFEGYQYCPDLVELLPTAYQIQTEETAA